MSKHISFLNMFPDYAPPEELINVLSQAAIVAADIDAAKRSVSIVLHSEEYISSLVLKRRLLMPNGE